MKTVFYLIIINLVVFTLQMVFDPIFTNLFALTPSLALNGFYWQFFTYMFLHGSFTHITLNMFVLLIFGARIEHTLNSRRFLFLYILSGLGSAFFFIFLSWVFYTPEVFNIPMLGASGAIFGILAAYALLYPRDIIIVYPGIPLPAIFAIIGFAFFEFFSGFLNLEPGIANFGHLGGIITGVIIMLFWKNKLKRKTYHYIWEY